MELGWGAAARRIYNVSYSNIDLIDLYPVSRPGDVINLYLTLVHRDKPVEVTNISFTNITFDKQGIKVDMPHGYAHVKGVRFENLVGQRGNTTPGARIKGAPPISRAVLYTRHGRWLGCAFD